MSGNITWKQLHNYINKENGSIRNIINTTNPFQIATGYIKNLDDIRNNRFANREDSFIDLYNFFITLWKKTNTDYMYSDVLDLKDLQRMHNEYTDSKNDPALKKLDEFGYEMRLQRGQLLIQEEKLDLLTKHIEAMEDKFKLLTEIMQMNFDRLINQLKK